MNRINKIKRLAVFPVFIFLINLVLSLPNCLESSRLPKREHDALSSAPRLCFNLLLFQSAVTSPQFSVARALRAQCAENSVPAETCSVTATKDLALAKSLSF